MQTQMPALFALLAHSLCREELRSSASHQSLRKVPQTPHNPAEVQMLSASSTLPSTSLLLFQSQAQKGAWAPLEDS